MNKLQILLFIAFLESVPTFMEMGFVTRVLYKVCMTSLCLCSLLLAMYPSSFWSFFLLLLRFVMGVCGEGPRCTG